MTGPVDALGWPVVELLLFVETTGDRLNRHVAALSSQEDGPHGILILGMPGRVIAFPWRSMQN